MAVSYSTIFQCANDGTFHGRVTACCAQEGQQSPAGAMQSIIWAVSSHSDIEAAYASAIAGGNQNPGGDPAVITDQMILSAVQAELAKPPPPIP
jgi:hypothetical protein